MPDSRSSAVHGLLLGRGEFLGRVRRRLRFGPLLWTEIAEREPTPVGLHTHEAAHVCLPFRGAYASAAETWAERPALAVLFHPAGTTHADRFLEPGGGCLTLSFEEGWLEEVCERELPAASTALHDPTCTVSALRALGAGREGIEGDGPAVEEATLLVLGAFAPRLDSRERVLRPWLRRARRLLCERFERSVRIAPLAREVGVHPVVLARGFRRHFGCTPLEFLRRVRVHEALRRLRWSRAGLAEIALSSGFADQAQFTRAVRRETGWTPAVLRAAVRRA